MSLMQEPVRVLVRCALPGPMRVTQGHIKPHAPKRSCHAKPDRCPSPTCKLIDDGIVNLDGCMPIGHVEQHREPGRALHECAEHLWPRCQWTGRSSPHTSSSFLEGSHGAPITSNRPTTHGYTTMRDATENVWVDKNLITANSAAGLDWAKTILEYLDVYPAETISTWYQYYSTGNPEFFFKLMAN